jgi:hypothetical protein
VTPQDLEASELLHEKLDDLIDHLMDEHRGALYSAIEWRNRAEAAVARAEQAEARVAELEALLAAGGGK